ncbi:hypothetical protein O0I10_012562 [Lichtheimia ornata]|uniref:Reverse transcriptase domain-containing protein n=1 Tax=Lichtheimia ornata TaxID=688661 RepID=A0AAD7USD4_9FUNG|nr:uncharacterized protein O0I10_012562 [Lichtheimia ornata]KAJ8651869.1 hypothetical protein O0I10_012562 [Lichtheimia ornata]
MTGHRPCLDPRLINEHLTDDKHRIPLITEIFDQLAGSKVYTTLDLASAFHRFPSKPQDRHKTAFTAPDGLRYMFKGCPFGLKPISSKFQRVMDKLFRDLPYVTTFVDDIIIFSKSKREHVQHVTIVIDRLTEANLILQLKSVSLCNDVCTCLVFASINTAISPIGVKSSMHNHGLCRVPLETSKLTLDS